MDTARAGSGNFLRGLFNPGIAYKAESTLSNLMAQMDQLDRHVLTISQYLVSADTAARTQQSGVQIFPGRIPVGHRFTDDPDWVGTNPNLFRTSFSAIQKRILHRR